MAQGTKIHLWESCFRDAEMHGQFVGGKTAARVSLEDPAKLAKNGRPAGCIVSVAAPPFALPPVLLDGREPSE